MDNPNSPGPNRHEFQTGKFYAKDPQVVGDILFHCGIDGVYDFGWEFDSPLLRFGNEKADAILFKEDEGFVKIKVRNASGKKKIWTIPDYYAAWSSESKIRHLSPGEQVIWWMRALLEMKVLTEDYDTPPVRKRSLPKDVRESVRKIYDGFVMLVKLRLLYNKNQKDHLYSYNFIRAWCNIGSNTTVIKGLLWLEDHEYLRETKREEIKPRYVAVFYDFAYPSITQLIKKHDTVGLVEALEDPDARIRELASIELIEIGKPALRPLIHELQSETIGGRAAALLARIGESAIDDLSNVLEKGNSTERQNAIYALARMGSKKAMKPLLSMLKDEDEDENIRTLIAEALEFRVSEDQLKPVKDIIDSLVDNDW